MINKETYQKGIIALTIEIYNHRHDKAAVEKLQKRLDSLRIKRDNASVGQAT